MESPDRLPVDVRELLDTSVDGVDALDALILLNADPSRWWAVQEVAAAIDVDVDGARRALALLTQRGLVADATGAELFRMAALGAISHAAFAALARACANDRAAVLSYLARRPLGRLRVLAEAFTRGSDR